MSEFVYNNIINTRNIKTSFQLNYSYQLRIFFKKDIKSCYCLETANKWTVKLLKLFTSCYRNLYYT